MVFRRKILLIAAVLVFVGAGLFTGALLRPEKVLTREVLMSELTRRGEQMYYGEENDAYTGFMIERYASDELKSRSYLVDGVLHGVSEGWYPDGDLQVREHFNHGVSHGMRTRWFEDGQRLSEATIENGKIVGIFRRWHANGQLAGEVEMVNDLPDGISRGYYTSGHLEVEALMDKGVVVKTHRWKDGEAPVAPHLVSK